MTQRPSKQSESAAVWLAAFVAMAMITQHVAGVATRDAFFLANYPATALPLVMLGSAGLSFFVVMSLSRLMTRLSPALTVPAVFVLSGVVFLGEWLLSMRAPHLAAISVYLHTAAVGAALVSGFWSVMNERFDPHTAKKVFGRIGAGASLGGVVGGVGTWQMASAVSLPTMLVILAGINFLCATVLLRAGHSDSDGAPAPEPSEVPNSSGLQTLREVPYLRRMAALVVLVTVSEVAIDYVFKATAADHYSTGASLVSFFAIFYTVTGVLGFLLQTALAKRALQTIGLTGTLATYPGSVAVAAVVALLFPGLWTVAGARGTDSSLKSSLFRSGYELLYTPVGKALKRSTKTFIDVGCSRLGGITGSGIAMLAIAVVPALANATLIVVALVAAAIALLVVSFLHRGYVSALADSLRDGAVDLSRQDVLDRTTRQTLAGTSMSIERDELLREMERLRALRAEGDQPVAASPPQHARLPGVLGPISDLVSKDPARIRTALSDGLDASLIPFAIPLLSRNDVQDEVISALVSVARHNIGQLVDSLLDPDAPFVVRRRLPRVLARFADQRAADGLARGLEDSEFEVRYRCASALSKIAQDNPAIRVDEDAVLAAARHEAEISDQKWSSRSLIDTDRESAPDRSLKHVFRLLGLVLDSDALEPAHQALSSTDNNLRGTALEYLENVLPPEIRDVLWPHLHDERTAAKKSRPVGELAAELKSSATALDVIR